MRRTQAAKCHKRSNSAEERYRSDSRQKPVPVATADTTLGAASFRGRFDRPRQRPRVVDRADRSRGSRRPAGGRTSRDASETTGEQGAAAVRREGDADYETRHFGVA
eukprot:3637753-Rhodomonas_salina.5